MNKEIENLENRVDKLEKQVLCLHGNHNLRFYDVGESTIPGDYYIRHVCKNCNKIFQRSLRIVEKIALGMEQGVIYG